MRNIFVISVFLCIFASFATAQELDPTVVVSREYEGKLVEVHKPAFTMAVPDSVTRFALDFDYAVFEKTYKGSYEFNPYLLTMKPAVSDSGENTFYLRAGAGYQLHPTLDVVWSPVLGKNRNFNLDVYALHRSFIGNYLTIAPDLSSSDKVVMIKMPVSEDGSHQWFGYDLLNKAGAAAKADFEKVALEVAAGYYGLIQQDRSWFRDYNAVDASFGLSTKPETIQSLTFDLDVDYRLGQDRVGDSKLNENVIGVDLGVGPFVLKKNRFSVDLGAAMVTYAGAISKSAGELHVVPRYVFKKDRFDFNAGIRFSAPLRNMTEGEMYDSKQQYVYPDVNLSYALLPNALKVFFQAGGGNRLDTYSSLIGSNHHITHMMPDLDLDYTVERVSLMAGVDGRITDYFTYNVRGGYSNYANMMAYGLNVASDPSVFIEYVSCQKWFAALDWALALRGLRFDGTVSYDHYFGSENAFRGDSALDAVLQPAALKGNVAAEYSWRRRVVAGIDCDFATGSRGSFAYDGEDAVIPGYADLGVYAEYATARRLTLWLRAGNLLNMTIQRNPLYAEKGVNCTVGICLNL